MTQRFPGRRTVDRSPFGASRTEALCPPQCPCPGRACSGTNSESCIARTSGCPDPLQCGTPGSRLCVRIADHDSAPTTPPYPMDCGRLKTPYIRGRLWAHAPCIAPQSNVFRAFPGKRTLPGSVGRRQKRSRWPPRRTSDSGRKQPQFDHRSRELRAPAWVSGVQARAPTPGAEVSSVANGNVQACWFER